MDCGRQTRAGAVEHGGLWVSRPMNTRAAPKPAVLEGPLARVSGRLETMTRQATDELRER